jgi:6-phosphogluconolactonase
MCLDAAMRLWKNLKIAAGSLFVLLLAALAAATAAPKADLWLFVGTYTSEKSRGIYTCRFNPDTGQLSVEGLAAQTPNPTFLAIHPNKRFLYAANEISDYEGKSAGSVSAFEIDASSGRLTPLNTQSSGGPGPCHLSVDATGKYVLVANYGGGSIASLPILPDGRLGSVAAFVQHTGASVNAQRQEAPHAHYIDLDASNRRAYVADLGLDKLLVYDFDPRNGALTANPSLTASLRPGAGPRHMAFDRKGHYAYVINELDSTITTLAHDNSKGSLQALQTLSTLPFSWTNQNSPAEIEVHPSGKFVYGSNRGHDSIAIYTVEDKGQLKPVDYPFAMGKNPRHFTIDPTGQFLLVANQTSDTIIVFRIDESTGKLTETGYKVGIGAPVCLKFLVMEK